MRSQEALAHVEKLSVEFEELARASGITAAQLEHAREGAFIPYGINGDEIPDFSSEQNRQLYWDNEHDASRRKFRKLIFALPDSKSRMALVASYRRLAAADKAASVAQLEEERIAVAKLVAPKDPWLAAAAWGVAITAAGAMGAGAPGALVGAVAGYFLGHRKVATARELSSRDLADAKHALEESREQFRRSQTQHEFFNIQEEITGDEDSSFGSESAFLDRVREFHEAGGAAAH